ncbi:RagB/SusD family nutrient uptake outer membrane protein [Mucilaginibacter dorajii]|uniref:RagB/SusD family nutrient uptake outer membrane protein n=2 Tax=Mucilaginibacter dorajii TaxID=692994 RepID=A0ABP7QXL5_9SPHI
MLEEKMISSIGAGNFYKTQADAVAAINSVYNELYTYDLYTQPMWNIPVLDDDHVSGASWYLGGTGAGNPQNYFGVDGPWVGFYKVIARANVVLEKVGPMTGINTTIQNRILGEAYFLRGWSYFMLVQFYGPVPIRLKSLSVDPNADVPRSPVLDVYNQIFSDLKLASTNLLPPGDPNGGESGRVNRAVADAFLAKAYLTIAACAAPTVNINVRTGDVNSNAVYTHTKTVVAGYEAIDSKAYFELARQKATEVINNYAANYPLFTSIKDMWAKGNRNKGEHMWELQSLDGSAFVNQLNTYFSCVSTFGRGAVYMTNTEYNDYEDQDLRALEGVAHNYVQNTTTATKNFYPLRLAAKYQVVNGVTYTNNGTTDERAYIIKFSDVSSPLIASSDAYYPFMRFAEVYLMLAEAENEVNGPTGIAYNALNMTRNRAKASVAPAGMTKDTFRDFVLAERAREFALENGTRHFDLIRWGIYLSVMNKITKSQDNVVKTRTNRNLLMPIPVSELNTNKLIGSNNPGW